MCVCECGPNIARYIYIYIYIYSSLASNVDFPIVVLIVFGGSASKVTFLFAKKIHRKHMLPMVNETSSHMIFKNLRAQPDCGCPSK